MEQGQPSSGSGSGNLQLIPNAAQHCLQLNQGLLNAKHLTDTTGAADSWRAGPKGRTELIESCSSKYVLLLKLRP